MPEKNADRLNSAAAALRKRGFPGDEHAARMLELCEPIATYWSEPYAAPFVPLLESALRLTRVVLDPEPNAETLKRGTVAVDFDGVIHRYSKGWQDGSIYDPLMPGAVEGLRALMARYAVFVFTARPAAQVAAWLVDRGFPVRIDGDPDSPEFWNARDVLLVTNRKLAAVAYLDDRAVRFTDWGRALKALGFTQAHDPAESEGAS